MYESQLNCTTSVRLAYLEIFKFEVQFELVKAEGALLSPSCLAWLRAAVNKGWSCLLQRQVYMSSLQSARYIWTSSFGKPSKGTRKHSMQAAGLPRSKAEGRASQATQSVRPAHARLEAGKCFTSRLTMWSFAYCMVKHPFIKLQANSPWRTPSRVSGVG